MLEGVLMQASPALASLHIGMRIAVVAQGYRLPAGRNIISIGRICVD
jgi:hypothetical protein